MNEILFYDKEISTTSAEHILNEDESYHLIRVLRIKPGQELFITNGKGQLSKGIFQAEINKKAVIRIQEVQFFQPPDFHVHAAVCLLKSRESMEWMIEKLTELGVHQISLIEAGHCERTKVNIERLEKIIVSALKQSFRVFLPRLNSPVSFHHFIDLHRHVNHQKFIAWCGAKTSENFINKINKSESVIYLIGPEGDFTEEEIEYASGSGFAPVSLGKVRFRSETAAIYALSAINIMNS